MAAGTLTSLRNQRPYARARASRLRRRRILDLKERLALLGAVILELEDVARQARSDRTGCIRALREASPAEAPEEESRRDRLFSAFLEVRRSLSSTRAITRQAMAVRAALHDELGRLVAREQAWADALAFPRSRAIRRRSLIVGFMAGSALSLNLTALLWDPGLQPAAEPLAAALAPLEELDVLRGGDLDEVFELIQIDPEGQRLLDDPILVRVSRGANATP